MDGDNVGMYGRASVRITTPADVLLLSIAVVLPFNARDNLVQSSVTLLSLLPSHYTTRSGVKTPSPLPSPASTPGRGAACVDPLLSLVFGTTMQRAKHVRTGCQDPGMVPT